MKKCTQCGEIKALTEFYHHRRHSTGFTSECKRCKTTITAAYGKTPKGREVRKKAYRTWREKPSSREVVRRNGRTFYARRTEAQKERHRELHRNFTHKRRETVIVAYGGRCSCCDERRNVFLTIDHVNNNGKEDRKRFKTSTALYKHIIESNFPSDYQLLCWNCNLGRQQNGGICPHITETDYGPNC